MDFLNQDCYEGLAEPLIGFNIHDDSNQGIVITDDATEESCHIVRAVSVSVSLCLSVSLCFSVSVSLSLYIYIGLKKVFEQTEI